MLAERDRLVKVSDWPFAYSTVTLYLLIEVLFQFTGGSHRRLTTQSDCWGRDCLVTVMFCGSVGVSEVVNNRIIIINYFADQLYMSKWIM